MNMLNACPSGRLKITLLAGLSLAFLMGATSLPAQQRQLVRGHVPAVVTTLQPISDLPASTNLSLAIGLPLRNRGELTNLLHEIYDPASTNYHHYLTPQEFTERFGPTAADYQAVLAFAKLNHLTVTTTHPNRMLVDVTGTPADIQSAFQVRMQLYKHPTENRNFFAPDREPSVPSALPVLDVSGLNNYKLPHPNFKFQPATATAKANAKPQAGSGPAGNYMGNDFRAAYVPGTPLTGAGQKVGLLQFDGYLASDIQTYENLAGLPNVPLQNILLDGYNGQPTGNGNEVEVSLDIEMVASMAPGVSLILVYEAGPFGFPNDILNRMATDDAASQLSASWGWNNGPSATTDQIFQEMDAQGQSFFHSSADSDALPPGVVDDPTQDFTPSDSPYITQVGGTTLTTSAPGGPWVSETVWNWGNEFGPLDAGIGSTGGISSFYQIPIWQQGVNMSGNMGSTTFRNFPDVALTADNTLVIADSGTEYEGVGGTSIASPLWAGFMALVNQQASLAGQSPVGFVNPAIYAIASGPNYNACFHDTRTGDNTSPASPNQFFAVPGYDLCTGWGTPNGTNLINALAPPTQAPNLVIVTNIISGGNGNGTIDPNECNSFDIILANVQGAKATDITTTLSSGTPGVGVTQWMSPYPDMPVGSQATNVVHFTVSTTTNFVCGTAINFTLVVKCDQITRTLVFRVNTGTPGIPVRFDNNFVVSIPDNNPAGASSPIVVSGIPSAIDKVTVALHITHTFDSDLTLELISPDGTTNILSANNGGAGQNYGINCTPDGDRTFFDDASTNPITAASPPYIGTFQPEEPLAVFHGKSGTAVNGTWQLHVIDGAPLDVGTIDCWSLFLESSICADGGGRCPGIDTALNMSASPSTVVVGSNLTYTITVVNNGPDVARGVAVSQSLPSSLTFVSATSTHGSASYVGNGITASLGSLDVHQIATITVVVTPTAVGTVLSTATVGSSEIDFNPANNSATVATQVTPPTADLAEGISANPDPVSLGGIQTYLVSVTNNGPSPAANAIINATLPANVTFVSVDVSQGSAVANGGNVICSLGSLGAGAIATASIQARAVAVGGITVSATASSGTVDPVPANNTASVSSTVVPASDVSVTMTGSPASVVLGNNVTYTLTVKNFGPSPVATVNISDTLPVGATFVSASTPFSRTNNLVTWNVTNLAVGGTVTVSDVIGTGSFSTNQVPLTMTNFASVSSSSADPNTGNNSAIVTTRVDLARPAIIAAGATLIGGNFTPPNGFVSPGETVTNILALQNIGNLGTTNLTATLLATNGVTPVGSATAAYGALAAGGGSGSNTFAFTAAANGTSVIATLQLRDGTNNLGMVQFPFVFPAVSTFSNTADITIPDHGEASPYPSSINVSGVSGLIGKVTVTLTNVNHTFPDDVDILLLGPAGQSAVLMSHAGDGGALTDVSLTFDDGAASMLPASSQITSGTYQASPYQLGSVFFPATNSPPIVPPSPPYGTNLAVFNGQNANGTWSLFVFDSSPGDQGSILGGWSLKISSGVPVNIGGDVAITGAATPNPVQAGSALTYTFNITNNGPNLANSAVFTDILPAGVNLVSSNTSQGTFTNTGGVVTCLLGALGVGTNATVTITVTPTLPGLLSDTASVATANGDLIPANNQVTLSTTVNAPVADVGVTLTSTPSPAVLGQNLRYIITVTNNGPNTALNVGVTNSLNGMTFVPGSSFVAPPLGIPAVTNGTIQCALGNLAPGTGAVLTLVVVPTQTNQVTDTVTVGSFSTDLIPTNNSASALITVVNPSVNIMPAGARLLSGVPASANGAINPGEQVTVSLVLTNSGSLGTSHLVATLLSTNGVSSSSGPQNYGAVVPGGVAVSNTFVFTATGANGAALAAVLQLQDGTNNLGTASFGFTLPGTNTFANGSSITIPDHGAATPYPSAISVSGLNGVVSKVTVTLSNLTHSFPNDIQALLTGPAGQSVVLMGGTGGPHGVTNVTLTFDDAAASMLSASGQIVSGTFQVSDYGLALPFPSPAPAGPYAASLAAFDGTAPNGTWSLFVFDNTPGDSGIIASGWTLGIATVSPVNGAADLGIGVANPPAGTIYAGVNFNYTINVTNKGPATATDVLVTNALPAGWSFVSAGALFNTIAGGVVFNLGGLATGGVASFPVTVVAASTGTFTNSVSVGADQTDLYPADNSFLSGTTVLVIPVASLSVVTHNNGSFTLSVLGQPEQTYLVQASTDLTNWTTVDTNTPVTGSFQYTDTNETSFPHRYFRVRLGP